MGKTNSLKRNAILNIIYKLSSMIFPLIVYPYVSRILLSEYLGKVTFFSNIASYGMLIGSLGISTYGIRAVAKVRDDKNNLSKTVKELLLINTVITAFVLVCLLGSVIWVEKFRSNLALFFISVVQIAIAPLSMEWLYGGLEQYDYITKRAILFKLLSLVLIFTFIHTREDYIKYALIMAIGYVGNYICNLVYSRKYVSLKTKGRLEVKKHLKPTLTLFASLLAISVYTSLDSLMLGFIDGDNAVGLYDVAVKAKTVILSLVNAISGVLMPRLSYYVANGDEQSYKETLKKSIKIILMISIPLTLFFMIEALDCILILGGEHYKAAVPCMVILMPILLISGFSNITGNQILIPHGLEKYYTKAVLFGAVIDIVLNVILMPSYGIYGAAIATLVAELVQMSIQTFYSRDYLKDRFDIGAIVKIVIFAVIAIIVVAFLRTVLNINPLVNIIISFIVFFGIYGLLLWSFKVLRPENI